jgi:hypothetical protein
MKITTKNTYRSSLLTPTTKPVGMKNKNGRNYKVELTKVP